MTQYTEADIIAQIIALKARRAELREAGDLDAATEISNQIGALNQQAWKLRQQGNGQGQGDA